jgi:two-component system cell cycle sensor histidine kinase/response regulator CckA
MKEKLERLAGRVAHDCGRLVSGQDPDASSDEVLEIANLVNELAQELAGLRPPVASDPAAAGELAPLPFDERRTALVVDGEPEDRKPVVAVLAAEGWTVLEAASGEEALGLCYEFPGPILLMLTNVIMPDMSGRELAERAAIQRPEMRVVYMSGYTDDEVMFYGILGPGVATLSKPVCEAALRERAAQALEAALV